VRLPLPPPRRIVVATPPGAFRQGLAGLAAVGRPALGDNPLAGALDVFRTRAGTALKLFLSDGQGSGLCLKRLSQGHCTWGPHRADARGPLAARARIMVLWHGNPARAQRARDWRRVASGEARRLAEAQGSHAAGAAHTSPRCAGRATRDATALPPAERPVAIRLVSTLALAALGGLLSNSEFLRCRRHSFQARAASVWSSGAPGPAKHRVRGTPWLAIEPRAFPSELWGSPR
jgi:hypothetical protein